MEIGIIYINYRSTEKIHSSLSSILTRTTQNVSIVIGDNSGEYLPVGKEKVIKFHENLGFGKAANKCVELLQADFVAIINPDTIFETDILTASVVLYKFGHTGFVAANQKSPISGHVLPSFGALPNLWHTVFSLIPYMCITQKIINRYWPLRKLNENEKTFESCFGAYLFISRETFREFEGFDERFFLYYEETDFIKRLLSVGYKNYILEDKHAYFHDIGFSAGQAQNRYNSHLSISRFKYLLKHHGRLYAVIDRIILFLAKWKVIFQL